MLKTLANKKVKNQILFFKEFWELKEPVVKKFASKEMKLSKWEDGKIKLFLSHQNEATNYYILVRYKNIESLKSKLDTLFIPQIKQVLDNVQKDFLLDLDITDFDSDLKRNIGDLLALALYQFTKYKKPKTSYDVYIKDASRKKKELEVMIESLAFVRDIVNEPPSQINPQSMEKVIKSKFGKLENVQIQVIKGEKLKKLGLGGIWAVGSGSVWEPRLVILKYSPLKTQKPVALVGKWVTFDSWGYNIKPTGYIEDMKWDMAGAATVLGALHYLATLKIKKNIIVAVPLVENLVSDRAYKPGDIIKIYNGKTIEVGNTDAEWRLVLADALSYIQKNFKPSKIIDLATLTGAQIIATWTKIAALMGKNSQLNQSIQTLSRDIYERVWELPLFEPYFETMKSAIADFNNVSNQKWSPGTITAGLFLSQFVDIKDWVHIDIAWPAGIVGTQNGLYWPGATGFGMRILTYFLTK